MRLIDADALLETANWLVFADNKVDVAYVQVADIMRQHTVDAVPVIRCRECKYYEVGQNEVDAWSACYAHVGRIIETWDDNFCGWAERKEK